MTEEEYVEHIRAENEKHRETLRQDYLAYIENVKQALIDIQTQQTFDTLRVNFATAALNGILAGHEVVNIDYNCELAWQYADKMIETMGELK